MYSQSFTTVEFTRYTGSGDPPAGQWKYVDEQTILIRGPNPWPTWCTSLMVGGNVGPALQYAWDESVATTIGYTYPYHGPLHYWKYDDENSYYGLGTRGIFVYNLSNAKGSNRNIFCTSNVTAAF